MNKTFLKAGILCAAVLLGAVPSALAATTYPTPNTIRMTADGDTFTIPSNTGASGWVIDLVETQPYTTGTLYQLLNATATQVIWETTSTETRPITDAGIVVTAVGGLPKISEPVTIQLTAGVTYELNTTAAAASGFTGVYLRRRVGGVK